MQQLFGQKVINDFIQKQDEKLIENRWQKYKNFLAKKEKISSWIETDYQDGFLEDIFENCLGYISKTRSTDEHYTLEREKKNETNGQKADGALLVDDKVVAVIELKDLKTKDLDKKYNRDESAVRQAFGYLQYNNHAKYVIVSNFNELRFYFDKATAYEQFFLFDLDYEGFKKLHTILSYESISKNLPQDIKEKSLNFEQDISNKLYKDYTNFRTHLFENILKNNQDIDKLELLNATQKLIDRIVFILFGEDTDLLPKNTIGTIIQRQKEVKKLVKTFTLYDSYKVYFEAINAGDEDLDITMYNGGLFAHDDFLDALIIDDEVLDARAKILSAYNFGSDISVNILGHIFENSISELEEMSAQLLDNDFDKKQSKRKKDGVFYTPAYITEYIVQNTLCKLCENKRSELNIAEVEAIANPKKPTKKEQEAKENLLAYKEWLLNLKILDPACGSGAFLNQALEYLLKEHKRLQNDLALMGDLFAVYEVEKEVLEHNLYGVDINEGAVEIARLSLWLRTAKRGRPLTKLANKIKVGNSLISDKTVVPNAFDWHVEFPEVFAQGGFDVVIGNPPYGAKLSQHEKDYLNKKFETVEYQLDTYTLFMEQAYNLLKINGKLGLIVPSTWLTMFYFKDLRKYLIENTFFENILLFRYQVFDDVTAETSIITLSKNKVQNKNIVINHFNNTNEIETKPTKTISQNDWLNSYELGFNLLFDGNKLEIINKIIIDTFGLEKFSNVTVGIKPYQTNKGTPKQTALDVKSRVYDANYKIDDTYKNYIVGGSINKFMITPSKTDWLKYGKFLAEPRQSLNFFQTKIMVRQTSDKIISAVDYEGLLSLNNVHNIVVKNDLLKYETLTCILNSKLMDFYYKFLVPEEGRTFAEVKAVNLKRLPIKNMDKDFNQQPFIKKADKMLSLNKNLQETKQNFINELKLEKLTKKLQNFEELTFDEFITEYTKSLKLKFADKLAERNFKQEWQAIFENDKTLACGFKTEIQINDKEIDKMVYELYGLSDDEIKIVEGI
ncbi:N-6 DNA methylase [Sulfurimonas sp.]|uniref:Eco57I restriction-modification methylase domain-containing protein n=1 Tax=Sulfurimonas sp. TaxID=2022749 RepID=UPI0025D27CFA|nr:N-6 DNA methylase [Sulfurimonas sp.]MCK9473066.1 N-6 DNA methylase [Sulfurimonas sp.]MDD3505779.1 N-6 DNA methylase [Sulfurimonas sp.]